MAAHQLLKDSPYKTDGQDLLFWQDPWNGDGQRIAGQIRQILPQLRLHAERAIALVAEARIANPNLRETDALDVLELGARRMDLIGQKFEISDEIATSYAHAFALQTSKTKEDHEDLGVVPPTTTYDPSENVPYSLTSRLYGNLEFIAWWQKQAEVRTLIPIAIGAAASKDETDFGVRTGGRATAGFFLDSTQEVGFEATYLTLGKDSTDLLVSSDTLGNPSIPRNRTITTFDRQGLPVLVTGASNFLATRPNSTGQSPKLDNPTQYQWFNTAAFVNPPNYTYGNIGRALPDVRNPGFFNCDFSMIKNTHISEGFNLQFRAEAFNLDNHTNLGFVNASFSPGANGLNSSSTFGTITSSRAARSIQLGMKFLF